MSANVLAFPTPTEHTNTDSHNEATTSVATTTARAVYTVAEVAALLSLSRNSAYSLVHSGEIPAVRLGGRWIIPKRRFHIWLDQLPEDTESETLEHQHSS